MPSYQTLAAEHNERKNKWWKREKKGKSNDDDDNNNNASKDVIIIYLKSDLIKSKENHVVALKIMHDINFVRCDFCTRLHNNFRTTTTI